MDGMVRMDAKRCAGHGHHVLHDARNRLFRAFAALDLHRQLGIAQEL